MGSEERLFDNLVQSLEEDGLSRFLTDIKPVLLRAIFRVQLEAAGEDLPCVISKTKAVLRKMEAGVNALREHERLMDTKFFEECVKDDTFLVKGKDKKGHRPVWWVRAGHSISQNWKHKLGSPKAHAFIRAAMFQYQAAIARILAEEEYGPDGPSFFIAFDNTEASLLERMTSYSQFTSVARGWTGLAIVQGKLTSSLHSVYVRLEFLVNMAVQEHLSNLFLDTVQPLGGVIVFCGFSKFHKFLLNIFFMVCPQKARESAIILNNDEEMDGLIVSACDKPHWFLNEDGEHLGKRRDPLDPREFWAYRRCIGEGKPLEFSDVYNPDPRTWLEGCGKEVEATPKRDQASSNSLEVIEENDEEDDGEGW